MKEIRPINKNQRRLNTVHTSFLVVRYLLWGLLAFLGVAIATLNAEIVVFHYFWNTASLPLYLLLLLSFTTGCLVGIGLSLVTHIKQSSKNKRLQQQNRNLAIEVTRLKADFTPEDF